MWLRCLLISLTLGGLLAVSSGCKRASAPNEIVKQEKTPTPEEIIAAARQGDVESILTILDRIEKKEAFPLGTEEAVSMLKQAADAQQPEAQARMGALLAFGLMGVEADIPRGLAMLKEAADKGDSNAEFEFASIYLNGLDGKLRNTKKGLEYLTSSYKKGNKEAQLMLGGWCGWDSQNDLHKAEAARLILPLANEGDAIAQRYMGYIARRLGDEQGGKNAEEWFKLGAEGGDVPSMLALGEYYTGYECTTGSPSSRIETAMKWFQKAAEMGDSDACRELAEIYSGNKFKSHTPDTVFHELPEAERARFENLEKAIEYYEKSIELGNLYSYEDLANIYLNREQRVFYDRQKQRNKFYDPAKAVDILNQGYEKGSSYAGFYLAQLYHDGEFVEKDLKKSFRIQVESYVDFSHPIALDRIEGMETRRQDGGEFIQRLKEATEEGHAASKYALANIFLTDTIAGRARTSTEIIDEKRHVEYCERSINTQKQVQPTPRNSDAAVSLLKSAAESGHSLSQIELGLLYENGEGVDKNLDTAFELYSKALENKNFYSGLRLGELYNNFDFSKKDTSKAIAYLEQYAEYDLPRAGLILGTIYLEDREDNAKDSQMALHWLKTSATSPSREEESAKAAFLVSTIYRDGDGVEQNEIAANHWLEKSAQKGYVLAIKKVADKNYHGTNGPQSYQKALLLYKQLAENGDSASMVKLAKMYEEGRGTAKNMIESTKWHERAASAGNLNSCYITGFRYFGGKGIQKNSKVAAKWWKIAAENGHLNANGALASLYYNGDGVSKDYALAFKYSLKGAEGGDPFAQNLVAGCYQNGYGTKKDPISARLWLEKAMLGGNRFAKQNLVHLLLKSASQNNGVKPDYLEASRLLEEEPEKTAGDFNNLGYAYENMGDDYSDKMISAYQKGAFLGSDISMVNLAKCYIRGYGVVKNYAEALVWLYLAKANGNKIVDKNISFWENELSFNNVQAAQAKAQALHEKIKARKEEVANGQIPDGSGIPEERSGSGSGVIVSSDGIVVTAEHVIDGASKILVRTSKGDYSAKVIVADSKNDIALLQIQNASGLFSTAPIASSGQVKLGETVFTLGFPNIGVQGFNLKMTKGEISSTTGIRDDPSQFQISAPVQPGNSGGPLFDSNGNVVGIVVAKLDAAAMVERTGDIPENVNYAVKSSYLQPLLENYQSQLPSPNLESAAAKIEDIVGSVRDSCVMIIVK